MNFKWLLISWVSLLVGSCKPDCEDNFDCWDRRMTTEAFDEHGFNLEIAKKIITDAPKKPDDLPMLNNKKGTIGAALMISIAMNETPTSKQKDELYEWAKKNKKLLGFDIQKLRE